MYLLLDFLQLFFQWWMSSGKTSKKTWVHARKYIKWQASCPSPTTRGKLSNSQVKMASDNLRGFGRKNIRHYIPTLQCIKYYLNLNIKCFCYSKIPSLVLLLKIYKIQSYVIYIKLYWSKIDIKYNNKEQFDGINFWTKLVAYYKPSNTRSGNDCCVDFHSWHTTWAACDNSFSWITSPILHWNSK